MNAASAPLIHELRPRILERKARLEAARDSIAADQVNELLAQIDATLQKIDKGSFGLCETCHDPIEPDRLECNPLVRFCLDHLTAAEARAHEADLALATQIQARLLPPQQISTASWETHYRYQPAGPVSGDYCEVVPSRDGESLFFALGDVSGKGVAASLLMTHLNAIVRSLLLLDLPLGELVSRANHLFCDSTPASHYATLVAGRTTPDGVELCNAGHCRPFVVRRGRTDRIDSTGLPLGLFCDGGYDVVHVPLEPGDSLVLYTDGITEAQDADGNEYDEHGLIGALGCHECLPAIELAGRVLEDVARFRGAQPPHDDLTLLLVRRQA
jgi:sigma-B regulation protein RsbU (phosphoserine phosphatase)